MSEPEISPLARRLAEENNVDWRRLSGTGPDGRVVERDVLEYLARVMAGDEALDPTPEPVPDGMQAWPEDDVQSLQSSIASAPAAEETPSSLRDTTPPLVSEPVAEPAPLGAQDDPEDIDEGLFLFEEDEGSAGNAASETVGSAGGEAFSFDDMPPPDDTPSQRADPPGLDIAFDSPAETPAEDDSLDMSFGSIASAETDEAPVPASEPNFSFEPAGAEPEPAGVPAPELDLDMPEAAAPAVGASQLQTEPEVTPTPVTTLPNPVSTGGDGAGLPLASYGVLLRRHLDLTALTEAHHAISKEFGHEEPGLPTPLLLRAAAKALPGINLGVSALGIALIEDSTLKVRYLEQVAEKSFGELQRDLEVEPRDEGDVRDNSLVVVDMSDLDIDEAVLNLGVPVMTLGRVLYDSNEGRYRSTLSLSGDIPAEAGAQFLARVAELLATPVRIII